MGTFKNISINEYFKRYGYKYGIFRALYTKCPIHVVKDYENQKILYYRKVRKWVKRNLLPYAGTDPEDLKFGNINTDNPVWIYWKQGYDAAPDLVKTCIESIKTYTQGDVFILSDDNIDRFITFPEYIMDKVEGKSISAAAFSDLLRFTLLEHYGGTWIDATVYLTKELPDYITNSELFAFRDSTGLINNPAEMSVWVLHANKGNSIIREVRNMSYRYWTNHKTLMEYLLPYIILTSVLEEHPEEHRKIPYANNDYCFMLLNSLDKKYDAKLYGYITEMTGIHKLSYKLMSDVLQNEDNFYNKIIDKFKLVTGDS